jgi:pre-mRNA-splicing factor ATP-dependent RNA helicase DHX16
MAGAGEIVSWVSDRLHEIVGLSDRQVAEYITEVARRSLSQKELLRKLQSVGGLSEGAVVETFAGELWNKFPRDQALGRSHAKKVADPQPKKVHYKLLLDDEPLEESLSSKETGSRIKRKTFSRNVRSHKSSSWESDDEDTHLPATGENSDSDEWESVERERKEDLAERDALSERIRLKDKEKTRHVLERSDKKAYEEAKKRHQLAEEDKKKLIPELRKVSRRDYLGKRRAEKVVELRDDLADERFLFSDSKLTRVEKEHLEYKTEILTLTTEHEQVNVLYFSPLLDYR